MNGKERTEPYFQIYHKYWDSELFNYGNYKGQPLHCLITFERKHNSERVSFNSKKRKKYSTYQPDTDSISYADHEWAEDAGFSETNFKSHRDTLIFIGIIERIGEEKPNRYRVVDLSEEMIENALANLEEWKKGKNGFQDEEAKEEQSESTSEQNGSDDEDF